ncbi:MAG: endonuclease III [Elusimicrobia bacterium]|nr:endonuclease III [Elusimicrobiota bacterium]
MPSVARIKAKQLQARRVLEGLKRLYPQAHCELDFSNPLELIVATILSAQCTDKRVNQITPELFRRYPDAQAYARADTEELERLIRSTGFYKSKAKSIQEMAKALVAEHGGRVPDDMEALLKLRGVARKTANVVLGTAYGKAEGVVVDTHVSRLSYRLGLSRQSSPEKIERDLMECLPRSEWVFFGHSLIWHGRRVCGAISPDCPGCGLNDICPKLGVKSRRK